jgi:hypothetical protein
MNNKQKAAEMVLAYLAIVGHDLALAKRVRSKSCRRSIKSV